MAWSTRELAELAGTSLRTVRHYHEVGLLAEPEREANGYKSYGVRHLVRLLHIKRLTDLGFALSQIAAMGDADEHPEQALRTLDIELAATIERLQHARVEIAGLLRHAAPTDLPADLVQATVGRSAADRAFVTVMSRVLSPTALDAYKEAVLTLDAVPTARELDNLPADADEETRRGLADRLFPQIRRHLAAYPAHSGPSDTDGTPARARRAHAFDVAVAELYNPAQLDVIQRVRRTFAAAQGDSMTPPPGDSPA